MNVFANRIEFTRLSLYSLALLALPIALGHLQGLQNQLVVGTLVNALLFVSAMRLSKFTHFLPIAVAPSIGAYASAIVFAADTKFLLYFLPAIWVANLVFMFCAKRFHDVVKPAFAKAILLFATAIVFVSLQIVPQAFLIAMGPVQLITALCGGFLGSLAHSKLKT